MAGSGRGWRNVSYFLRRKVIPGFRIRRHELVIDIGSGDRPFWRGDVFYDDLSLGDEQRASGSATVRSLRPLVSGDICQMPFKDGAFDFSFCAHVLEHVEDPAAAIREITRVSQRGYIEVPNGVFESMAPFRSHLWFVYYVEGRLLFVRKSKSMHDLFAANSRQIGDGGRLHEPFIRFPWSGQIDFEVVDDLPDTDRFAFRAGEEGDDTALPSGGYVAAVRMLRRAFHHRPSRSGR